MRLVGRQEESGTYIYSVRKKLTSKYKICAINILAIVQYLLLVVEGRVKVPEEKSPFPVLHRLSSVEEGS